MTPATIKRIRLYALILLGVLAGLVIVTLLHRTADFHHIIWLTGFFLTVLLVVMWLYQTHRDTRVTLDELKGYRPSPTVFDQTDDPLYRFEERKIPDRLPLRVARTFFLVVAILTFPLSIFLFFLSKVQFPAFRDISSADAFSAAAVGLGISVLSLILFVVLDGILEEDIEDYLRRNRE